LGDWAEGVGTGIWMEIVCTMVLDIRLMLRMHTDLTPFP